MHQLWIQFNHGTSGSPMHTRRGGGSLGVWQRCLLAGGWRHSSNLHGKRLKRETVTGQNMTCVLGVWEKVWVRVHMSMDLCVAVCVYECEFVLVHVKMGVVCEIMCVSLCEVMCMNMGAFVCEWISFVWCVEYVWQVCVCVCMCVWYTRDMCMLNLCVYGFLCMYVYGACECSHRKCMRRKDVWVCTSVTVCIDTHRRKPHRIDLSQSAGDGSLRVAQYSLVPVWAVLERNLLLGFWVCGAWFFV